MFYQPVIFLSACGCRSGYCRKSCLASNLGFSTAKVVDDPDILICGKYDVFFHWECAVSCRLNEYAHGRDNKGGMP